MREPEAERRSLSRGEWVAVTVAVLVVAAAVWIWVRKPPAPPPQAQPAAVEAPAPVPAEEPVAPVADPAARAQLEALSTNPAFRRWLAAADDVIRRWAVVTDNLAEGVSPRKALDLVAPRGAFQVVQRGGKTVIAPASYARYDEFASAVASVDARAFATVYRALRPAIQAAYRGLGYPKGSLDDTTARALRRLEAAPVASGEVEVAAERGLYVFLDGRLEGLTQVDKHLLRMGPRNGRLIQAKARELREALGFPAQPTAAP